MYSCRCARPLLLARLIYYEGLAISIHTAIERYTQDRTQDSFAARQRRKPPPQQNSFTKHPPLAALLPPLSSHHGMYLNRRQDTTHFCSSSGTLCTIYPTAEQINITISCFLVYSAGHRNRALLCWDMAQAQTIESPHWG